MFGVVGGYLTDNERVGRTHDQHDQDDRGLTLVGVVAAAVARRRRGPGLGGPDEAAPAAADPDGRDPDPDAPEKPDSPDDLTRASWIFVLRKTAREFTRDQCTDVAAALTYYAVLALFPAAIALLSLVGVVGQGQETVRTVTDILRDLGATGVADTLEPILAEMSQTPVSAWVSCSVCSPRCGRRPATSEPSAAA